MIGLRRAASHRAVAQRPGRRRFPAVGQGDFAADARTAAWPDGGVPCQAAVHAADVMPGFTHLQTAPPVTFGHHCMGLCGNVFARPFPFRRCCRAHGRMSARRGGTCGTSFPIDRNFTAGALGFREPTRNSLDSVSDRDFALDFPFCCGNLRYPSVAV